MTVDRSDLQCPDCQSPLESLPRLASQYDDPRHRVIYASRCPNGGCPTKQVPPGKIRPQLHASDTSGPLGTISTAVPTPDGGNLSGVLLASVIVLFFTVGLLMVVGLFPFSVGSSPTGTAAAETNLTEVFNPTLHTYNETGNWTIYEYNNQYVVTGKLNGTIVYLTQDGNVTRTPYFYDLRSTARQAILAWSSKHDQNPAKNPNPDTPPSTELNDTWTTNWSVFEYNGSYVVASRINGTIVYLYPNKTYHEDPFFYENKTDAKNAIINWESYQDQFPNTLPSLDPVTVEEVESDLEEWDPDESSSESQESDSTEWDWDNPDDNTNNPDDETNNPDDGTNNPADGSDNTDDGTDGSENGTDYPDDNTNTSEGAASQTSYTVQGEVTDTTGDSVEGATVHLHSTPRTTTTGPNGTFRFEEVSTGDHQLFVEPNGTSLAATSTVNFTMSDDGSMTMASQPDHVVYFETSDGTVANNSVQIVTRPSQPIAITGEGSALESPLVFDQPLNAKDTTVTLSGVEHAAPASESITSDAESPTSEEISIDGNAEPQNQTLQASALPRSKATQTSGTYTGTDPTIDWDGNRKPRNIDLTLQGAYEEMDNKTTRTIRWSKADRTADFTDHIDIHRSDDPPLEKVDVFTASRSGPYSVRMQWDSRTTSGDENEFRILVCGDGTQNCRTADLVTDRYEDGGFNGYDDSSGTLTTDVSLQSGETVVFMGRVDERGSLRATDDAVTYDGRLTEDRTQHVGGNLNATDARLQLTAADGAAARWDVPEASSYLGWYAENDEKSGSQDLFTAPTDGTYTVTFDYGLKTWYRRGESFGKASLEVTTTGGETLFSKQASSGCYNGCYSQDYQGTKTVTVDLEEGERIVKKYELTKAASANIDGREAGIVLPNEDPGQVQVTVDGDTYSTEYLETGESTTLSLEKVSSGTTNITVTPQNKTGGGRELTYALVRTERTGTKDPQVAVGGQTVCRHDGVLRGDYTCDLPRQLVSSESQPFDFSTTNGTVSYEVAYDAVAVPETVTVTINGQTYSYPADFGDDGTLTNVTRDITALQTGTNTVTVSASPVDGIQTAAQVQLRYEGAVQQTKQPTVLVETPNGTQHTKAVPEDALTSNGKLLGNYTLSVPAEWFSRGENTVVVRTPDQSVVAANVTASGLTSQYRTFNRTNATS